MMRISNVRKLVRLYRLSAASEQSHVSLFFFPTTNVQLQLANPRVLDALIIPPLCKPQPPLPPTRTTRAPPAFETLPSPPPQAHEAPCQDASISSTRGSKVAPSPVREAPSGKPRFSPPPASEAVLHARTPTPAGAAISSGSTTPAETPPSPPPPTSEALLHAAGLKVRPDAGAPTPASAIKSIQLRCLEDFKPCCRSAPPRTWTGPKLPSRTQITLQWQPISVLPLPSQAPSGDGATATPKNSRTAKPQQTQPTNRPSPPPPVEPARPRPRPHWEACRGLPRPAEGLRAPGGRCGTSSPPGSQPSARRSSRCSAARSLPPRAPGTTRSPRPPLPSRPTSRRTGPPWKRPPARTPPRPSAPETGGRHWSSPSSGSATSTPPSSHPFSDRYRLLRGSSPPPTASTAESGPPSQPSPTASATPRRHSPPRRYPVRPIWRRFWRNSRPSPSRPIGFVEAFLRSSSPPPGGNRRRSSSRLCRASCSPCTTRRSSAASTIAAPRPVVSPSSCLAGSSCYTTFLQVLCVVQILVSWRNR